MSGQIRYSDEFKIDAVAQVVERGYSFKELAERLGISTKSIFTWMAKFPKPQRQADHEIEVRRLKIRGEGSFHSRIGLVGHLAPPLVVRQNEKDVRRLGLRRKARGDQARKTKKGDSKRT